MEFELEKNGHKFRFANFALDQYSSLGFEYSIDGGDMHYGRDYRDGILYFWAQKIDGKKVDGIQVAEHAQALQALKDELLSKRKRRIEDYKRNVIAGTESLSVKEVGRDWPHKALYPKDAFGEEVGYPQAYDALRDIFEGTIETGEVLPDEVPEGEISYAQCYAVIQKLQRRRKQEEDKQAAIERAKATGQPQLIAAWIQSCCDPREECDVDQHREIAMPDGTIRREWNHTW